MKSSKSGLTADVTLAAHIESPADSGASREAIALLAACCLLFALRYIWISLFGPTHSISGGDHAVYYKTALSLLESPAEWTRPGSEFGYRAPLFFIVLAAVMGLTGIQTFAMGQLTNAFLGVMCCLVLFFLVRRVVGRKAAWIAFWIRGLLPCFFLADTFVLSEVLFALLLLSALLAVAARSAELSLLRCSVAGASIAGAWLTREAALPLPFLFAAFIFLSATTVQLRISRVAAFGCALVIVLLPWLIRNEIVWDSALPISYTSGVNLHIGNNPGASGRWVDPPAQEMPATIRFGTPEFNEWHADQARTFITENPATTLSLGFKKIAWFLWPRFPRYDLGVVYPDLKPYGTVISSISGLSSALLIFLGVFGAFLCAPRNKFGLLMLGITAAYFAVTFVVVGHPRYRDAIDHLLILTCASFLAYVTSGTHTARDIWSLARAQIVPIALTESLLIVAWIWVALRY